ncbi:MAG TPA: diacylglycerol kinase family protein [Solirubrobacterales bacterium]|jgi:YegS/Rv2252/BmrU family lipid kinase|nr:diacylglycerol kinase family protein [Solirubrobacterales bacterium]
MEIAGMPLTLLVNPSSAGGKSLKLLPRVEAVLDARRVEFRVERTRSLEHGVDLAQRAVELGEVPVVISGDGLMGAVGGALAGTDTPVGLIPGGRGNDLARALGIPDEPEAAIEVVLAGHSRRIDVGEANGKRFLGIVSVGFDSECNRLANETHFIRGNLVYAYSMVRTLIGWRSARFTVVAGGERKRLEGYFVDVANNSVYGGGMYIAPEAEIDDGLFDVVAITEVGKLRFLRGLRDVLRGAHIDKEEVTTFRASRLELDASRPFPVYADGDHLTDLPVSLKVLPRCLSILVPA